VFDKRSYRVHRHSKYYLQAKRKLTSGRPCSECRHGQRAQKDTPTAIAMKETDLPQSKHVLGAGGENQSATEPCHPVLNVPDTPSVVCMRRDGKLLSHAGIDSNESRMFMELIICRNLTEVENELARVKAMLQQTRSQCDATGFVPPSPYSIPMLQASSGASQQFDANESDISMLSSDDISRVSQQPLSGMTAPSVALSPVLAHGQANADSDSNISSPVRPVVRKLENTHHIPSKSSLIQVGLEPTQCFFEWDERTCDAGDDGSADGMAILPSESDIGGYLGKKPSSRKQELPSPRHRCHIRSRLITLDGRTALKCVSATHSHKPPSFASGFSFYICSVGQLCRCIFPDVSRMLSIRYLSDRYAS
jgi:hypothetical protein